MAENKYDLALIETLTNKPVKPQEWYKERLRIKYLKKLKPGESLNVSNSKNWIFLKDGLDDFRDGLPPVVRGSDFIKSDKGPGPAIHYEYGSGQQVKQPAARKRLNNYQTYLSKSTPQQQQRRDYITEVEQGLLKHPLALYPHLEESVAPERHDLLKFKLKKLSHQDLGHEDMKQIFEDIVDLLDPQFNVSEMQYEMDIAQEERQDGISSPDSLDIGANQRDRQSAIPTPREDPPLVKNPYRWIPRKDHRGRDGKKNKEEVPWPTSQSEEEHIKEVTQEFCDWVAALGGESNNIEESTITSLFASGYETKPALSVPIHVVELTNVPQELRMSAAVPPPPPAKEAVSTESHEETSHYEPSWVKFRYGAWYLAPKTWKKMDYNEPLADPKQLKDSDKSETKKKSESLNQELATMHASKAFTDFISKKGTRRPEFLVEVAEIQRKAAEEEQKRQEAELLAKMAKSKKPTSSAQSVNKTPPNVTASVSS